MFELPSGMNEFQICLGVGLGMAVLFGVATLGIIALVNWLNEEDK